MLPDCVVLQIAAMCNSRPLRQLLGVHYERSVRLRVAPCTLVPEPRFHAWLELVIHARTRRGFNKGITMYHTSSDGTAVKIYIHSDNGHLLAFNVSTVATLETLQDGRLTEHNVDAIHAHELIWRTVDSGEDRGSTYDRWTQEMVGSYAMSEMPHWSLKYLLTPTYPAHIKRVAQAPRTNSVENTRFMLCY